MKLLIVTLLFISTTTCIVDMADIPADVSDPPETVKEIDLPNYLGRWYQMYGNRYTLYRFKNVCTTADYGLNLDGTVSVENNGRVGYPSSPNGTMIQGFAYIENPAEPGQLLAKLTPGPPGEYWIIKLGPLEETFPSVPLYQYAVVTDSRRVPLFVLARNPEDFRARFDGEVLAFLKTQGFTQFYNAPKAIIQEPDCIYAGEPSETKTMYQ